MASVYHIDPDDEDLSFPDPCKVETIYDGIIAVGGDVKPQRLIYAYSLGIFPWYDESVHPILWYFPDARPLLFPSKMKISKSFRRVLRNAKYQVTFDTAFRDVLNHCATIPRKGEEGTWLNEDLRNSFSILHILGYAHSVEVWMDEQLVGGLYGLAIGGAFFGESMFSFKSNASKIALKAISDVLNKRGYDFIDCQVTTSHLLSLGAVEIPKQEFCDILDKALKNKIDDVGSWSNLKWEYSDGK